MFWFQVVGAKIVYLRRFLLKKKYNMNPLTCTWSPGEYTDIGWKNYRSWINSGFDNILFTPNKKIHEPIITNSF